MTIKCMKIDRTTGSSVGTIMLSDEQFATRALNKTVVALPVEKGPRPAHDAEFEHVGEALVIPDLSDLSQDVPPEAKVTFNYTVYEHPVEFHQTRMKGEAKRKRDQVRDAGIEVAVLGGTKVVQTDADSRRELISALYLMDTGGLPQQLWRFLDNTFGPVPAAEFSAMVVAVGTHVAQCYARQAVLEGLIDAAHTVAVLKTIDIGAGWPAHYTPPAVR